jgi:hypothetical protein
MSEPLSDISNILRLIFAGVRWNYTRRMMKEGSLHLISTTPLIFSSLERFKVARTPPK